MEANIWNIDTSHSSINFSVRHMVFAKVRGRFGAWNGKLELDQQDLTQSRVRVEIDAASIDTGVAERDNHLRSPDFLEVERFPKLGFESRRIESLSDGRYRVVGELTIKGTAREITLEVEHGGQAADPWGNQRVAFTAKASIDRTDFGLEWNQLLEAGGVLVGERVDIELEIQAVEAAASRAA